MLGIESTISSSPTSALLNKTYGYNGKNEATYIQTSWGRIDYKYNEQSLRVVKIPPTSTDKRWYVFSGTTLIGEVSSAGATLVYTHGADGLVSMRDVTTNTSRFFHYGAQGETRYLTNSSGTVTDSYYYEAYGVQIASSGSTYNPYRYGGKFGYYKDDSGESLLATWRWYSPSQMRWINRDPIKFDGGSNVYQYVSENPVKFVDPSGLSNVVNNSPRPVVVSGNPAIMFAPWTFPTGHGEKSRFILQPGQRCDFFHPVRNVGDVDSVDKKGDGFADEEGDRIHGTSMSHGEDHYFPTDPADIRCAPGSYGPGCEVIVVPPRN